MGLLNRPKYNCSIWNDCHITVCLGFIEKGTTVHKDIVIVTEKDLTYGEILELLEQAALEHVTSHGAVDIRHYYIESIQFSDSILKFIYGT